MVLHFKQNYNFREKVIGSMSEEFNGTKEQETPVAVETEKKKKADKMKRFLGKAVGISLKDGVSVFGILTEYDRDSLILVKWQTRSDLDGKTSRREYKSDNDPRDQILVPRKNVLFVCYNGPSYKEKSK